MKNENQKQSGVPDDLTGPARRHAVAMEDRSLIHNELKEIRETLGIRYAFRPLANGEERTCFIMQKPPDALELVFDTLQEAVDWFAQNSARLHRELEKTGEIMVEAAREANQQRGRIP